MTLTNNADIFNEILEDSASNGGANNANGTLILINELDQVLDRVLFGNKVMQARYQEAIQATTDFSNPPTAAEAQTLIDTANLSLEDLFKSEEKFNDNFIIRWDVSGVTNMYGMFYEAKTFNRDIGDWDVSNVTTMSRMFYSAQVFNQDIGDWDIGSVTDTSRMFLDARLFNQDIGNWDVSRVTDMKAMFQYAYRFNQDIGSWDVHYVTSMADMFFGANDFNQDISGWDVSNVTNMSRTFYFAEVFNQDIGGWDVSNVTAMNRMFSNAWNFDQDISDWDISSLHSAENMFRSTGMSMDNFDRLLAGWATLDTDAGETAIQSNVIMSGRDYSDATSFYQLSEVYGWSINDSSLIGRVTLGSDAAEMLDQSAPASRGAIIHALDGDDTLIGGSRSDTLVGGGGDDVLTGGDSGDHFVFRFYGSMTGDNAETGHDTITDFDPNGGDIIEFGGPIFDRFNDILNSATQYGPDVLIHIDTYNSLRLANTDLADLHPDNFFYDVPPRTGDIIGAVIDGDTMVASGGIDIDDPGGKIDSDYKWSTNNSPRLGTATVDGNGDWTYTLDNTSSTVLALKLNETLADTFDVRMEDTNGNVERTKVYIVVFGKNDPAVFGGDTGGVVGRDDVDTAFGTLTSSDIDGNNNVFLAETVQSTYGSLTIDAAGHWTYTLDHNNTEVLGLGASDTLQDVMSAKSEDGTQADIILEIRGKGKSNFAATDNSDTLIGSDLGDRIEAARGDDVLFGHAGNDTLYGYEDDDTIWGGVGDDLLYGYYGHDLIYGEDGNDSLYGGPDDDTLYGNSGNDFIQGVHGADLIEGGDGDDTLLGGIDNDALNGGAGDDSLDGGEGEDSLNGGFGEDTLYGGDGNDTLDGYFGDDTIFGEAGHNRLLGHAGDDYIEGGDGEDTVNGGAGDDYIVGNGGDDQLAGGNDNDTLHGGEGHDKLYGNAGDDSLNGGNTGNDTIEGGTGQDTLHGGVAGRNWLYGGADNDVITGGASIDNIDAGDGDDTIYGNGGDDILSGGSGADTFVFAANNAKDVITDFDYSAGDVIDLSGAGTGYSSINDIRSNALDVGTQGLWINLGDGNTLFLRGHTLADLNNFTQDSFVF